LLLNKCMENYDAKPTEHNKFILSLVYNTCQQIYIDASQSDDIELNFAIKLQKRLDQYFTNRTIDAVNSNTLFLIHLFMGQKTGPKPMGPIPEFSRMAHVMADEEARRLYNDPVPIDDNSVLKLLCVNKDEWVTSMLNQYDTVQRAKYSNVVDTSMYRAKMINLLKRNGYVGPELEEKHVEAGKAVAVEATVTGPDPSKWTPKITDTVNLDAMFDKCILHYKLYAKLDLINKLTAEQPIDMKNIFSEINTPEKKFVFVYQMNTLHTNANRREAIAAGKYVDPFDQEACIKFITSMFIDIVTKMRKTGFSMIDNERFSYG
jgi:hypothetical protein